MACPDGVERSRDGDLPSDARAVGRGESGQATLLAAGICVLAGLLVLALAALGTRLLQTQAAEVAAEAAALAALRGGRPAAEQLAARNGATVVEHAAGAGWVQVSVLRAGRRAMATAALVATDPPSQSQVRTLAGDVP